MSNLFPVNTGVRQDCVPSPSLFNTCMDWVLGRVVQQSHCGASVSNTEITDFVVVDDAAVFAESVEAYWMKQYSLSMRVARTLRSCKTSHTLVM